MRSGFVCSWTFTLAEISGIDLQRQLIASGRELPVIMMTAIDNEATRREAFNAGCIPYLKKPFLSKIAHRCHWKDSLRSGAHFLTITNYRGS